MAAAVLQSTQTTKTSAAAGSGTFTVNYPAGVAEGDLLLLWVQAWLSGTLPSVPSGWTALGPVFGANTQKGRLFWRIAPASPGSSVGVAYTATGSATPLIGVVHRITGHNPSAPIVAYATNDAGLNGGPLAIPSVTPTGVEQLSVVFAGFNTSNTAAPALTNYSTPVHATQGNTKAATAYRALPDASATGTLSMTGGGVGGASISAHILVAPTTGVTVAPGFIAPAAVAHSPAVSLFLQTIGLPHITGTVVPDQRIQPGDQPIELAEWTPSSGSEVDYQNSLPWTSGEDYTPSGAVVGTRVFEPAIEVGAVQLLVPSISTTELYAPTPGPALVDIAWEWTTETVLNAPVVLLEGQSLDLGGFGDFATQAIRPAELFDPSVQPGEVVVELDLITGTLLWAPTGIDLELPAPFIASGTVLWPPVGGTMLDVEAISSTQMFPLHVGQYLVLEEPDDAIWGSSGGFSARIDVLDVGGGVIASTATASSGIVLVSGSVSEDITQPVTRECSVRLLLESTPDGDRHPLLPSRPGDPLDPRTGGALAIYAGPIRPSGEPALVKLGVFRIVAASSVSTATGESLSLRGLSEEHVIAATPFFDVFNVTAGTPITQAIGSIVTQAVPNVRIFTESSAVVAPAFSFGDSDNRNAKARELANAVGMTARFDRNGWYRIEVAPDPFDAAYRSPRWTFSEGVNAVVQEVARELDDSKLYNGVIVVGEPKDSSTPPVRAQLWDTNPASPVYYNPNNPGASRMGPRPKKVVSPIVATVQQAQALCSVLLSSILSWPDRISVTVTANPSIEAGDMARVVRTTMGVNALYEVQAVTHDLLGGASEAICVARI